MSHFTQDYVDFFTELAFNNEKSWFDKNRKRYELSVREPFKEFTMQVISEIQKFDKTVGHLEPKDVMFRINRDIRFAKDKTPYNTWLSAYIAKGGKRSEDESAGYYFRFAVDSVMLGGGLHYPSREKLTSIRRKIAKNPDELQKILRSKAYKEYWQGEVRGEENKVIPKEFKEAAESEPLIKKKGFSFHREYPEMEVVREDLLEWIIDHFKAGKKFNEYLRND